MTSIKQRIADCYLATRDIGKAITLLKEIQTKARDDLRAVMPDCTPEQMYNVCLPGWTTSLSESKKIVASRLVLEHQHQAAIKELMKEHAPGTPEFDELLDLYGAKSEDSLDALLRIDPDFLQRRTKMPRPDLSWMDVQWKLPPNDVAARQRIREVDEKRKHGETLAEEDAPYDVMVHKREKRVSTQATKEAVKKKPAASSASAAVASSEGSSDEETDAAMALVHLHASEKDNGTQVTLEHCRKKRIEDEKELRDFVRHMHEVNALGNGKYKETTRKVWAAVARARRVSGRRRSDIIDAQTTYAAVEGKPYHLKTSCLHKQSPKEHIIPCLVPSDLFIEVIGLIRGAERVNDKGQTERIVAVKSRTTATDVENEVLGEMAGPNHTLVRNYWVRFCYEIREELDYGTTFSDVHFFQTALGHDSMGSTKKYLGQKLGGC